MNSRGEEDTRKTRSPRSRCQCDARPRLRVHARHHVHGDDLAGEVAAAARTSMPATSAPAPRTASWICTSSNPNRLNRACITSEWNIARVGMKPARRIGRATCSIDEPRSRVRSTSKNAAARRAGWSCSATMREMSRGASRGAVSSRSSVGATAAELLSRRRGAHRGVTQHRALAARPGALGRGGAARARRSAPTRRMTALRSMTVSAAQRRRFEAMVERRLTGEPVNYITGHFRFCGLDLTVRPGVFSPRASSEFIVELATARLRRRRGRRVAVDVATGPGAIALAIAPQVAGSEVWGVDISADAARLGRLNARRLQLDNARFATGDMLAALPASAARRGAGVHHPSARTWRAPRCAPCRWRSAASSRGTRSPTARRTGSAWCDASPPTRPRGCARRVRPGGDRSLPGARHRHRAAPRAACATCARTATASVSPAWWSGSCERRRAAARAALAAPDARPARRAGHRQRRAARQPARRSQRPAALGVLAARATTPTRCR